MLDRVWKKSALFAFMVSVALAQSDRGTITGTVVDQAGAVVASAAIEARNVDNGATYSAGTSGTGNFTLAQVPTGNYELSVTMAGFKGFKQTNIFLPVAQTIRIDPVLEVGATTDSITVTDQAPLLKTESAELSHNVQTDRVNNLPVLPVGTGAGARNPFSITKLIPGASFTADSSVRINGMPANTQSLRIEGQDAQTGIWSSNQSYTQPSVDAIQEVSIQTSNFAAEFGQAGGGVFNTTMKSGTNTYHGSAYDYLKNEAFNAGTPNTNRAIDGRPGEHRRNRVRQNDYGFTFGGAIRIPKLYNGRDKSFAFFSFEQFRETQIITTNQRTVPVDEYRNGDFRRALGNAITGTDKLGRSLVQNQIYDPLSETMQQSPATSTACPNCTGQLERVRQPFATNNVIPLTYFDPVALAVQSYMPKPNNGTGLLNNYIPVYTNPKTQTIPSIKLDHSLSASMKLSGYYGKTSQKNPTYDGMPYPITSRKGTDVVTDTIRINFDYTVTPTMLLHMGAGFLRTINTEQVDAFDVRTLGNSGKGLQGTGGAQIMYTTNGNNIYSGTFGGYSQQIGPSTQTILTNNKPTGNISLTWVRNNHTIKFGGETIIDAFPNKSNTYASPWVNFSTTTSSTPSLQNAITSGGTAGFGYASFLMGLVDNGYTAVPNVTRLGKHSLSGFVQDNWKVTRKLTLEYGLRYDFQTYLKEHSGYNPNVGPGTPNPLLNNRMGGTIFEGYGPGKCQCAYAKNYPWAFGPRLSAAYQINSKTVIRAGFGVSYTRTAANNFQSYAVGGNTPYSAPQYATEAYKLKDGLPYKVTFPNFDPGQLPYQGIPAGSLNFFDQNAGRPGRTMQWTVFLQREIARDLVIEAGYVANRGAWFQSQALVCDTCLSPDALAKVGLDVTKQADQTLLTSALNSTVARQRGFATPPYDLFPTGLTVRQSLTRFPQYTSMLRLWAPLGSTWYDSLQTNVTKRYSHGLDLNANFTWSRQLAQGVENEVGFFQSATPRINDVFNRKQNKYLSAYDQPFMLVISGSYTTPKWGNAVVSQVVRGWTIGAVMRYASGTPAATPTSNNNGTGLLGRTTFANYTGQPFYLKDPNCKCFDPQNELILNPAAWSNAAPGQFGTAAGYYTNYRNVRRPDESMSLARNFRMGPEEKYNLQIRAEFSNIFNRWSWPNPGGNPFTTATNRDTTTGVLTAGYGFVDVRTGGGATPRSGTIVVRFTF